MRRHFDSAVATALVALVPVVLSGQNDGLAARISARIAQVPGAKVGVYYRDLDRGDSLLVGAGIRLHAASTMKIPVMIQVFRDVDGGSLSLDDSLPVSPTFQSIVDGSPYDVDKADDSDSTLYARIGAKASVRDLLELMITISSNLATNLLITRIDPERANATAHWLGADSIAVLRGVEDSKAYQAGRNNTTTARDLGVLLGAIELRRAATPASCEAMLQILGRQRLNEKIPAGLPPGTRVAHKTGDVDGVVNHDAAIVYPPQGGHYVLVVLTGGIEKPADANALIADVARMISGVRGR